MKKIISLMLAILLIAAALVACDEAKEPSDSSAETTNAPAVIDDTTDAPQTSDEPSESTSPDTVIPETTEPVTEPVTEPITEPVTEPVTEPETTAPETEPPHVHSYGEWEVTRAVTCTEFGERVRRCSCGETLREDILPEGHKYVDGICSVCGENDGSVPTLRLLEDLEFDNVLYSTPNMIVFSKDDLYYIANRSGEVVSRGYDGAKCVSQDEYVVMYETLMVSVNDIDDEEFVGLHETITLLACYVLDNNGRELFSTRYTSTVRDMGTSTYEGEYIASCSEGRIITYTPDTYHFPAAFSPLTVNIYDMSGTKLATFDNVVSVGTLIDGELLMLTTGSGDTNMMITNSNGRVMRTGTLGYLYFFPNNYWTTNGFIGGYAMVTDDTEFNNSYITTLIDESLKFTMTIRSEYLYAPTHHGPYVASRIVENGVVSDKYYLVDLVRCETDGDGYCIPTIDAAKSKEGFDSINIESYFNQKSSYALVSRDGKWGFMSLKDGSVHMFDDAGYFFGDLAIVIKDGAAYIVNEDLEQISEPIEGATGVSTLGYGVYRITKDGRKYIAVYDQNS